MSQRRVVVTGMGMVSPLGNDMASSWDGIVNGRSGIGEVTSFDASSFATRIVGEVRGLDIAQYVNPKDAKKMDAFIHYGMAAALMALDDSGLEITEANAERVGAIIGSGGIGRGYAAYLSSQGHQPVLWSPSSAATGASSWCPTRSASTSATCSPPTAPRSS